jgi:lantibiotic modifying enzyme
MVSIDPLSFHRETAILYATGLFQELRLSACEKAGRVRWQMPRQLPIDWQKPQLAGCGPYLYNGILGISLSLASHAKARKDRTSEDLALAALEPLRKTIAKVTGRSNDPDSRQIRIGGLVGLGSLIYGLTRIGQLLGRRDLILEAHALTNLITVSSIDQETRMDVAFGCTGLILGLIALHQEQPQANRCGGTPLDLAERYTSRIEGLSERDWGTLAERLVRDFGLQRMGYAHGLTGVLGALVRVGEATHKESLRDLALEGFAVERELLMQKVSSLDLGGAIASWCHGVPGLTLACAEACRVYSSERLKEYLSDLCSLLLKLPKLSEDQLCCGNMGVVEALLVASRVLGSQELLGAARNLAWWVLRRGKTRGFLTFFQPARPHPLVPSLFRGNAGVGLTLLRLCSEEPLPCVLLMN